MSQGHVDLPSTSGDDDARAHVTKHETTVHVQELIAAIQGNSSSNKMQWVAVVGVGTVLLMAIVPWMMWMIGNVIPANTEALVKIETQSEDVEGVLREVHSQLKDNKEATTTLTDTIKEAKQ